MLSKELEILGAQVIANKNGLWKIKKWARGWHPDKGKLTMGWTGKETKITYNAIIPNGTFTVREGDDNERKTRSHRS